MPRGYWRVVAALGGLILTGLLASGYYYLESAEQQPHAAERYQPARDARLPVLVKNGKAAAEPYQPNCQSPQNKDDADLCAQWGAVQATNEANRLARIGLRVTYLEFAALIVSLVFTGWAAIAKEIVPVFFGYISYRDVFKRRHFTTFKAFVRVDQLDSGGSGAIPLAKRHNSSN